MIRGGKATVLLLVLNRYWELVTVSDFIEGWAAVLTQPFFTLQEEMTIMFRNNVLPFTILILLSLAHNVFSEDLLAPDFQLLDVNSTSSTYNLVVSPRDFIGGTSSWYFGSAT